MAPPKSLKCLRCGTEYPIEAYDQDCPRCAATAPSNLVVSYGDNYLSGVTPDAVTQGPDSQWRYAHGLPVAAEDAVSLGEGRTPLVPMPTAAAEVGIDSLHGKAEYANPTGSYKDRHASVAISAARSLFDAKVIATSSSGNAGAAAAAYAARAGMPCVVFTFGKTSAAMLGQIKQYGAAVVSVRDKADRWTLLAEGVRRFGWFPTSPFFAPAVGSNPLGLEGYKTMAYEIVEQLGGVAPDWVVVPVCYGDAFLGVWRGFEELSALGWIEATPRMAAAEIYGSLTAAVADGGDAIPTMPQSHDTVAFSIGALQGTYQSLAVVRASDGAAVQVSDDDIIHCHELLGRSEGIFVEPSSAASVAAVRNLQSKGRIQPQDKVVCVLSASGLKVPTAGHLAETVVPVVPPDLDRTIEVLRDCYEFDPGGGDR